MVKSTGKKKRKYAASAERLMKELQKAQLSIMTVTRKLKNLSEAGNTATSVSSSIDAEDIHPTGRLRIQNTPSGPQYFQVINDGNMTGRYLSKKNKEDMQLAAVLAQREYVRQLQKNTDDWLAGLTRIEKAINTLPAYAPENLYDDNLPRRNLITPVVPSDAEYIAQWQSASYRGKPFSLDMPVIVTNRGERVRSKSEKIIADRLSELQIPYRYEKPVKLSTTRVYTGELGDGTVFPVQKIKTVTLYPDFTILAPDRTEILLEHFGLLDSTKYANSFVEKMRLYAENGYFPGENLIISAETDTQPLDTITLIATIQNCLAHHA